jgi:hypothetical protein
MRRLIFQRHEVNDDTLYTHISKLTVDSPVMEVFRIHDEITIMSREWPLVSYNLLEQLNALLEHAMKRENITYKELCNRAMWRDEDN